MGRYTTPAAVLASLGADPLDPELLEAAVEVIAAAEDWLDGQMGRPFGDTDSLPGEGYTELLSVDGPFVLLGRAPVSGMTSVAIRSVEVGAELDELEDGIGYELLDPQGGLLRLASWHIGAKLRVHYVVGPDSIPTLIRRAALLLAGAWLRASSPAVAASSAASATVGDIKAISIEGALRVDYATSSSGSASSSGGGSGSGIPAAVWELIDAYLPRRRIWFAALVVQFGPAAAFGLLGWALSQWT